MGQKLQDPGELQMEQLAPMKSGSRLLKLLLSASFSLRLHPLVTNSIDSWRANPLISRSALLLHSLWAPGGGIWFLGLSVRCPEDPCSDSTDPGDFSWDSCSLASAGLAPLLESLQPLTHPGSWLLLDPGVMKDNAYKSEEGPAFCGSPVMCLQLNTIIWEAPIKQYQSAHWQHPPSLVCHNCS